MADLLTFDAANQWIERRVSLPTARDSARISAEMPANVRQHAFFSAQITQANVLEELRTTIGEIAAGRMGYEDGRNRMQSFLDAQGVGQVEKLPSAEGYDKAAVSVRNIASTRRIDLILRQNVRMAHAVGQRQVGMAPAIAERWPYWRYVARMDGHERPEHGRLNNLVLPKDDPFWSSHTPPWEFGCRCRLEHCDEEEAQQYGGIGKAAVQLDGDGGTVRATVALPSGDGYEVMPPQNGFEFRPEQVFSQGDMSLVRSVKDRQQILAETIDRLQQTEAPWRIVGSTGIPSAVPRPPPAEPQISREMDRLASQVATGRTAAGRIDLGELLPEHAEALGIKPGQTKVRLVSQDAEVGNKLAHNQVRKALKDVGTRHWNINHHEWMKDPQRIMQLLRESLWNPAASIHIDIRKGKRPVMVIDGGEGKGMLSLSLDKDSWLLDFLSIWQPPADYRPGFLPKI